MFVEKNCPKCGKDGKWTIVNGEEMMLCTNKNLHCFPWKPNTLVNVDLPAWKKSDNKHYEGCWCLDVLLN